MVGEVQEKGQMEQNISYELRLFYSSYYTADTSNRLVWYDLFQICTIDLNFFKLIQIYFTAPSIGTTDDTVPSVVTFKSEVHIIYIFSLISFGFSLVSVVLAGVSQAATFHNLTVVADEVNEKGQMEHRICYVLWT